MADQELTPLGAELVAGLSAFCDAIEAGTVDRDFTSTTYATNGSTAGSLTADDLAATVADIERRYKHLPIGVRASQEALASIRATASTAAADLDRDLSAARFGLPPLGLVVWLDRRLPPGDWRFVYSWDEVIEDEEASRWA